jgi:GAF domain-containing protein
MASAAERLHLLYEVNRRLATFTDLAELVRYTTSRTRELFGAEGCALLLYDRDRGELRFPVASQSEARRAVEARLAEVRFPADRGIAGWVLARGEAVLVEDVRSDPRFYAGVDQLTEMTTRTVLCAPLRTKSGNIGVIEVVNPAPGAATGDDLEFLTALAGDIAVAHEKVELHDRLRGEVIGLRQACGLAGVGLGLVGVLLVAGMITKQLAWALPLRELPLRPGPWVGLVCALVGGVLVAVGRGWLVGRTPAARL